MEMVEVKTINPHQYRQKNRVVGEKYLADSNHLPLLKTLNWAKPVKSNEMETESITDKIGGKQRASTRHK